jgi:hypothetical protein
LRGVGDALAAARIAADETGAAPSTSDQSARLLASYRERACVRARPHHRRCSRSSALACAWCRSSPDRGRGAAAAAILLVAGPKLTLFHLVALLLVAGVGSNYALFFERETPDEYERQRTVFAVAFCAATTALAFGLLAWSQVPVLKMIGATAAIGAVASLAFATLIARGRG